MSSLHVLVLAAGKGTQMKSLTPKILHPLAGRPMIERVLDTAALLRPASCTLVVGHQADLVEQALAHREGLRLVLQEPQAGVGHALVQAAPSFEGVRGTLLLLFGDVPLVSAATLTALLRRHHDTGAAATCLTAPGASFPRATSAAICVFDLERLFPAIGQIEPESARRGNYLPELADILTRDGATIASLAVADAGELAAVDTRSDLAAASRRVYLAKNDALMAAGVTIEDPSTTSVDDNVAVGPDTVLQPSVWLHGCTSIGPGCRVGSGVRIVDSTLDTGVTVLDHCVITGARLARGTVVGPFAHLRPETVVAEDAKIGNFVELKKTRFGAGSKASHLAYLGDATIGERVNIGAGTITCNYDGVRKNPTVIEDDVFIGSDSQLIAPVRVGRSAYVAAGSSITDDVPPGSLAIARGRQVVKEGWVEKKQAEDRRKKMEERSPKSEG